MTYRVRLDLFEGPLDLLLHLIKKNEVDVTNLPVATITEQYLAYLDLMRDLSLDVASEYLVMAATLTLLKSRLLLPSPEGSEDEEDDPRADLVRQLLEYQRYREAAESLDGRIVEEDVRAERLEERALVASAEEQGLVEAHAVGADGGVSRRAEARPARSCAPCAGRDGVAARPHRRLLRTLGVARTLTSRQPVRRRKPTRSFVIVTFLAVLELAKLGAIAAVQEEILGPILIVLAVEDVRTVTIDLLDDYSGTPAAVPAAVADE